MIQTLVRKLLTRLGMAVPMVLLLSLLVFVVLRLLPADPLGMMLPPNATVEDVARLKAELGLDRSIPVQYAIWVQHAIVGNFGHSISFGEPVSRLIANSLPATLELSIVGLVLALIIAIPGGLLSYLSIGRPIGALADGLLVLLISIPAFLWAIFLMLIFGVLWPVLPFTGRFSSSIATDAPTGFVLVEFFMAGRFSEWADALSHLILPGLSLALGFSPLVIRVLRSSLIEAATEQYTHVARLRGVSEGSILLRHMLKNAALPTLTLIGVQFGFLFGGTLLIEMIFSFPGMGNLMVKAVRNHDLPLIQGIALVFCVVVLVINMVVEALYLLLNPKLRT